MPPHRLHPTASAAPPSQQQQAFFLGTPLSKFVAFSSALVFFTMNARKLGPKVGFHAARIRDKGEIYRYVSSKVTFTTTGEVIMGTLLLVFLLRKFEREMGSRRMFVFVVLVSLGMIAVEAVLVQTPSLLSGLNLQYAGPYALIGALFGLFHRLVPRQHPRFFSVLGFHFSEKVFYYLWLLQVAGASGYDSLLEVTCGVLLGWLYLSLPVLQRLDAPDAVAAISSELAARMGEVPPRVAVAAGARGRHAPRGVGMTTAAAAAGPQGPLIPPRQRPTHPIFGQAPPPTSGGSVRQVAAAQRNPPPADPQAVEQLTMMGFSQSQVIEALQYTNNDVQRAADRLLTQQGVM